MKKERTKASYPFHVNATSIEHTTLLLFDSSEPLFDFNRVYFIFRFFFNSYFLSNHK
jgi:hypothetical protein